MKKDDELPLNDMNNDARAINESELLPVFEAMKFSGDIQPLEDFSTPDPVVNQAENIKTDTKSNEKSKTVKKKKIPKFSGITKIPNFILAAALSVLVIGGIIFGIYNVANNQKNNSPVQSIYASDKDTFIRLENEKTYKISGAQEVKVTDDGMLVYYSKNTATKTGLYDLCVVDASKIRSLKKGGSVICTGVDEGWSVNNNGRLLSYSSSVSGIEKYYLYSFDTEKSEEIARDVDEVFLPPTGDVVYFTRKNGSIYSLHRVKYGGNSENVASAIDYAKFCSSEEGCEVIYTIGANDEENEGIDIFIVKNLEQPRKICTGADEVYLNDYVYGGNLYYFTAKNSQTNWQDFIVDNYYDSDAGLVRPVESDYLTEVGFFFKRTVLDSSAYNAAKSRYDAKLKRDEIRKTLDETNFGEKVEDGHFCYVYNTNANKLLATGVSLENILAFAPTDAPRIIFKKSAIKAERKIQMDELVKILNKSDVSNVIDYVNEALESSDKVNDNIYYSWYDGSKVIQYTINDYYKKENQFFLASRDEMYGLTNNKLYCNTITQAEISRVTRFSDSAMNCELYGEFIYYNKDASDKGSDLYRYNSKIEEQLVAENVCSYVVADDNHVFVFTTDDEASNSVTLGVFDGNKYTEIDTDVSLSHFTFNGGTVAYVKGIGSSDVANAGIMKTYSMDGSVGPEINDVTDIKYIRNSATQTAES